ncbi:MAG: hypothetical protein U9Q79_10680, partial [Candidatus Hydrogenedentes bacterium]|nr:hypothetical protein [Candidatus Hydrogenedentota bacterium]
RLSVNADWTPAFAGVTGGSECASFRDAKPGFVGPGFVGPGFVGLGFVGLGFVGPAPSPVMILV